MPERFAFDGLVACAPLAGAVALGWSLGRAWRAPRACAQVDSRALWHGFGTARRLDISGLGQLRLTVQQEMRAPDAAGTALAAASPGYDAEGVAVTLLPGATVWPCCILLRLRAADGTLGQLTILPDSVSVSDYRRLAVAVRALANGRADNIRCKIL